MTGHFLLHPPAPALRACNRRCPQALLPGELPVGPLRVASPYVRRFSAAHGTTMSCEPYHRALYSSIRRKVPFAQVGAVDLNNRPRHVF
jgi:hypothetical protein